MNQAIQDAIDADNYYLQTGKTRGPLHGLPISLKDTIDVEGVDSTIGIIKKSFKPAKRDATVVEAFFLYSLFLFFSFFFFLFFFFTLLIFFF